MKRLHLTALSLTLAALTAVGGAYAADGALARHDARFLEKAAQASMLEIDASKLAVERAQDPRVKEFAQRMVTDHTALDQELKSLAQSRNLPLPTSLKWGQARTIKSLRDKSGVAFDEKYVHKVAVDAHEDAVDLFEEAAEHAEDADVKAFAVKTLPGLQQHLAMGKALAEAADDDRPDGLPPGVPMDATRPGTLKGGEPGRSAY